MINKCLQVKLGNWTLDNPIIPASGTYGYGLDYINLYDPNILGSLSIKGTTLKPRYGNELPRITEYEGGMINSVGLQNPGINEVIKKLHTLKKYYKKKVIANIAGTSIDEYVQMVKKLNNVSNVAIYEINVSCPNVAKNACSFDTNVEHLSQLVSALKKVVKKPIYIKLSPRAHNIVMLAKIAEEKGADGLVLVNTMPGMRIDINTAKPILNNKTGGCSGPALKPIAIKAIYDCYKEVDIPIIGSGGISNAYDVIEMMYAGASAIEIGSANLVNPLICKQIIEELPSVMEELKIKNLSDIIGKAHRE
jgi:dihydroorotate dehydrogenase (NAD+) catalytic subunit